MAEGVAIPSRTLAPVSAATIAVCRAAQQLGGRGELHEAAVVDHGDPMGESGGVVEGVGDQQGRELELGELLGELVADLRGG